MTTTRDEATPAPVADGDRPDHPDRRNGAAPVSAEAELLAEIATALREVRRGSFTVRLPRRDGVAGQVVEEFNAVVALQERRNRDLLRISRVGGREGRMLERLNEESYDGAWADGIHAVNA